MEAVWFSKDLLMVEENSSIVTWPSNTNKGIIEWRRCDLEVHKDLISGSRTALRKEDIESGR